jgi:hypothetical protein
MQRGYEQQLDQFSQLYCACQVLLLFIMLGNQLHLAAAEVGNNAAVSYSPHPLLVLLQDKPTLYALWPDGTCARLGLEGVADTTLSTMLQAMVNASNTPALASVLSKRLQNITQTFAGSGSASAASQVRKQSILLLSCNGDAFQ